MPCGGGKTIIFTTIMRAATSKQKSSLMVVRGKELVGQTARRLEQEGIACNIIQGDNTINRNSLITIASIDTLYTRQIAPLADLTVIDEAHLTGGAGYEWLFEKISGRKMLSVTATPFSRKGMQHLADEIVYPVTFNDLVAKRYLVGGRYFAVQKPDLSEIKKVGDDYNQAQLSALMEAELSGNAVKEWLEKAEYRPTIIFAVSVAHSKKICAMYNASGIITEHVDANTPDEERADIFGKLRRKEIHAVSNVGVLTTGVDLPEVSCLQVMRPTMSYALWIQMLGRATRIAPGKKDFLVLDHSNNTLMHGMIEQEVKGNLEPLPRRERGPKIPVIECPRCLAIFQKWPCPSCGYTKQIESREKNIKQYQDAKLVELTESGVAAYRVKQIIQKAMDRGYKKGWCYYQLKERFGPSIGDKIWREIVKPMPWSTAGDESP